MHKDIYFHSYTIFIPRVLCLLYPSFPSPPLPPLQLFIIQIQISCGVNGMHKSKFFHAELI